MKLKFKHLVIGGIFISSTFSVAAYGSEERPDPFDVLIAHASGPGTDELQQKISELTLDRDNALALSAKHKETHYELVLEHEKLREELSSMVNTLESRDEEIFEKTLELDKEQSERSVLFERYKELDERHRQVIDESRQLSHFVEGVRRGLKETIEANLAKTFQAAGHPNAENVARDITKDILVALNLQPGPVSCNCFQ